MFDPDLGDSIQPFDPLTAQHNIHQAITLLSQVSPSNPDISKCNALILNYLTRPDTLPLLLRLLIDLDDQPTPAKIIITFISSYLRKQVEHGVGVTRHCKKSIYRQITEFFFCETVSPSNKGFLEHSFTRFISSLSPELITIREQLCNDIVHYFDNQLTTANLKNCFYLIRIVLASPLETKPLRFLQQSLLPKFVKLSYDLIKLSQDATSGEEWTLQVFMTTELLFIKATTDKLALLKEQIINSTNFAQLVHLTLGSPPSFFSDRIQLKISAMRMLNDALSILLKTRKALGNPKYISIMTAAELVLDLLPKLVEELYEYPFKALSGEGDELLVQYMVALSQVTRIPMLQPRVVKMRDLIFFRIVYPCMVTSAKDNELSSEDYCRMKNNIVSFDDNLAKYTVHEAAGKLCESLADELDGTLTHAFTTIISLIDFQLTADPQFFHPLPPALTDSYYYQHSDYCQQIEAGLTILSVVSYYGDNRMDLCQQFEQLIVRRQSFFSRIDVSCDMLVSFMQASAFYLSNFYELILQGKIEPAFHLALISHVIELMKASYCVESKDFFGDNRGKVGYQARDYLENVVCQKLMIAAMYPDHDPNSLKNLKKFFAQICYFVDSKFGPKILEDIVIEFLKRQITATFQNNYSDMSTNVRGELAVFLAHQLFTLYPTKMQHETLCKAKIFEAFKMLLAFYQHPQHLMRIAFSHVGDVLDKQFSHLDDIVAVLQVFIKSGYLKQSDLKQVLQPDLIEMVDKCVGQAIRVGDRQLFQTAIFDLVLHCNLLGICSQTIMDSLLTVVQDNLSEKDVDEEAEAIIQKCLYLMLQLCYSHFDKVSGSTWLVVVDQMVGYLRANYVRQDTITVGKAVAICLCCYVQEPQPFEQYIGTKLAGLWDCIIEDELKYSSKTEKKVVCLKLLELLSCNPVRPAVLERTQAILKSIIVITYYCYEKEQMAWHDDSDDDDKPLDSDESESEKKHEPWIAPFVRMRDNPFLEKLPDECLLLRDVCHRINEQDREGFSRFLDSLPVGLQSLVKNKIYNYKQGYKSQPNKKLRTIVKVRRPD